MKQCPECDRAYYDETLNFCLDGGTIASRVTTATFIVRAWLKTRLRQPKLVYNRRNCFFANMRFALGTRLGHYVIRSLIGAGGMGEVYLAEDEVLRRKVAIKVLPDRLISDPRAEKRMLREARAAATLDHPHICSIYEVGQSDGLRYIAMQFIEGEELDEKLRRGTLDLHLVLNVATQLADALTEAHSKGIIHRDLKPPNIMITPRGDAKIMDFGLAKLEMTMQVIESEAETAALLSSAGVVIGTVPYMSPEQVRGQPIDSRSDLFSFGIVLYEMVSGQRPFKGGSSAEIASGILTFEPPPLTRFVNDLPHELQRIVEKLLHKDPDDRYQTARDVLIDLRTLRDELEFQHRLERSGSPDRSVSKTTDRPEMKAVAATETLPCFETGAEQHNTAEVPETTVSYPLAVRHFKLWIGGAVLVLLLLAGGWWLWHRSNVAWAKQQIPRIEELSKTGDYFAAFDLASEVGKYSPDDPALNSLMATISDTLSVTSNPAGAEVYLKRFMRRAANPSPERQRIGTTPITNLRVGRGQYILYIEKDGYAKSEQTISGAILQAAGLSVIPPPMKVEQLLLKSDSIPERMTFVPGGEYRLVSWERPTEQKVQLNDYFIDKYEVSSQDFKEFVNAGGYLKKQFWKYSFVKDGKTISWDVAMQEFKDRTGLPGPRSWSNQNFPDGKADYPVTDVTWYEAAAYADFRGKTLPTIYQWEKAARNGQAGSLGNYMPWGLFYPGDLLDGRANFDAGGTTPVIALEFGMSPFGAYNMAGNVSEWTLNDSSEGYIATGGSWGDPTYTFAQFGRFPGFYSSARRGFRCVLNSPRTVGDQGGSRIEIKNEIPVYTPSSKADYKKWAESYRYEKTPLEPQIIEVVETDEWRREKITYNGAGGERAIAYLYLPKNFPRPLQIIQYIPAADVDRGLRAPTVAVESRMAPLIKSGRAVFCVVLKGYTERLFPASFQYPDKTTAEYRDLVVDRIIDIRRGLDYLESRDDLDIKKMALYAPSAGARVGIVAAGIEDRYSSVILVGAGVVRDDLRTIAEANPINFAPHIGGRKLVLQGRFDEDTPLKTQSEPLYKLLPGPKQMVLFDGGHVPPIEVQVPVSTKFLDESLGPIKRE